MTLTFAHLHEHPLKWGCHSPRGPCTLNVGNFVSGALLGFGASLDHAYENDPSLLSPRRRCSTWTRPSPPMNASSPYPPPPTNERACPRGEPRARHERITGLASEHPHAVGASLPCNGRIAGTEGASV